MCVTDLDLDLNPDLDDQIAEDEQAPSRGQQGPGQQPAAGQAPGVAWG
jgi:hypothetical protein